MLPVAKISPPSAAKVSPLDLRFILDSAVDEGEQGEQNENESAKAQAAVARQQVAEWMKVAPRKRAPKAKRNRKGWGPYNSVLNERSVDFNLTLDVQSLKQEILELTSARDLLRMRVLMARHTPDGSLLRTVREFYNLFGAGQWLESGCPHRQLGFLLSTMSENVDIGGGFYGRDLMIDQFKMYGTTFGSVRFGMSTFTIVQAEESVIVSTLATYQFQVSRATIEAIFPHIAGEEDLISRLVGHCVTADVHVTFCFNGDDECVRYTVDTAFFPAFAALLRDPKDTALLMGRALITQNSMLGLEDD